MGLTKETNSEASQAAPTMQGKEGFTYKDYYRWMNEQLTLRISSLAIALLGNPTYKRTTEWRYGDKKHLVVHIAGQWQGRFHDFETGESGDALNLVQTRTGYTGKALSDWVKAFIGYPPQHPQKEKQDWTPITPVPSQVEAPDIEGNKYLNYMLRDGNQEIGRYAYRDVQGNLKGYVFRFEKPNPEDPDGKKIKITPPLAYCVNARGFKAWKWQAFERENKTPYGIEKLALYPNKPILVVEGEKKADAAQKLLSGYNVLTWCGGTGSVHLTDWSVLAGREVTLWRDFDEPGLKCMIKLKSILEVVGVKTVFVVQLPPDTPPKWDLADALPESWTRATLHEILQASLGLNSQKT